jgi:hypothetical protein
MKYLLCLFVVFTLKVAKSQNHVEKYYADLNATLKEFAISKDTASYLTNQYHLVKKFGSKYVDLSFKTKVLKEYYTVFGKKKTEKFISTLAKNSIDIDSHLKRLSKSNLTGSNTFLNNIDLEKIVSKNRKYYKNLFSEYNLLNSISANSFHAPDQLSRIIIGDYTCLNDHGVSNVIYYSDSLNLINLYHLIEDEGFPKNNNVGAFGYFILFFHTIARPCNYQFELPNGKNVIHYFDSVLLSEVYLGNFSNTEYAFFKDNSLTYSSCGNSQQSFGILFNEGVDIFTIEDIETVDERRAKIFLPPLWVDSVIYGFKLPEGYPIPSEYSENISK